MKKDTVPDNHSRSLKVRRSSRRKPGKMGRRKLLVALLLIAPLLLILFLAFMAVEREPLVVETAVPTVESAQRAKNLAREVLDKLNSQHGAAVISAPEDDLNDLLTLVNRGEQRFAGKVVVLPGIIFIKVTVRLPSNPLGRYLNLRGEILPDERGLSINLMKIGKLGFPRPMAGALLKALLTLGLGNNEGTALLDSVKSISITGRTVTIDLRSVPQLKERLKRLQARFSRLREISRGGELQWDNKVVRLYYLRLLETDRKLQNPSPPSLAFYIAPLFKLARERSKTGEPVRENSAALLALAIYLGDPRFDKLAGLELSSDLLGRSAYGQPVHLGGRKDLRLHFVISAGLKLLTDRGISSAVGEFKELLDAGRGGSGFSFVDLAADRAGIRFAETATNQAGCRRLQELLTGNPMEQLFFPIVADLPEDMPKTVFEQRFGGVDKAKYNDMVREIDRRIDQCPVFQEGPHPL